MFGGVFEGGGGLVGGVLAPGGGGSLAGWGLTVRLVLH